MEILMWEDWVFLIGGFVGALILLPTLRDPDACVPRRTSVPTAGLLAVYTLAFYSLGMYLAVFGSLFGSSIWVGIAAFRAKETALE